MQTENLWSALIALIIGATFGIAFYYVFADLITSMETPLKLFCAVIVGIVLFRITLLIPIKAIMQDDTGRTS